MSDNYSAQPMSSSSATNDSYVDTYAPPTSTPANDPAPAGDAFMPPVTPEPSSDFSMPSASDPVAPTSSSTPVSQALEDQNIFFLLGVEDGTEEEKEAFLDELQQVIWEDFLQNDVELLVTEEEMAEVRKLLADKSGSEADQQERVIGYLEKLVPDLEEIMLEKALELKEDMVKERILGMREYHANNSAVIADIDKADAFIADNQWRAAAEVLNKIP